jgi:hypothetical protein
MEEIMPKQVRLNENAEIYQPRKKQTEKEKLSEMSLKDKVSYLWEYYKLHALVIVLIIATIIYIVKEIVTPNIETQLYAAIINNTIESTVLDLCVKPFTVLRRGGVATEDIEAVLGERIIADDTIHRQALHYQIATSIIVTRDTRILYSR